MQFAQYQGEQVEVYLSGGAIFKEAETREPKNIQLGDDLKNITTTIYGGITGVLTKVTNDTIIIEETTRAHTDVVEISKKHIAGIKTVKLSAYGEKKRVQMAEYHRKKKSKSKNR